MEMLRLASKAFWCQDLILRPLRRNPRPARTAVPSGDFAELAVPAVGFVEAASLEDDPYVAEDLSHRRATGGTGVEWVVVEGLYDVEILVAAVAVVFVGGQAGCSSRSVH